MCCVILHALPGDETKLNEVNLGKEGLNQPPRYLETIILGFFIQAWNDSCVDDCSPVIDCIVMFIQCVNVHKLLTLSVFLVFIVVAMNCTSYTDTSFFLSCSWICFLKLPDVVVVSYSGCNLVLFLDERVFTFKLDHLWRIRVLTCMQERIVNGFCFSH